MINENTLRILNKYGFGADINSLESFIIDYKQSNLLTDMSDYEYQYMQLGKILTELKGDSSALNDSTMINVANQDLYDHFFTEFGNYHPIRVYGSNDLDKIEVVKNSIGEYKDIIGILNVQGIDIKCSYIYGKLYKINLIGEHDKYDEVTESLRELVPENITELKEYKLVELRGRVTIFNNRKKLQSKSLNTICSTMRCIRNNIWTEDLSVVFNDIYIETEDLPFDNQWDKIEYMRDIGLSIPHHGLIRNVEPELLAQTLKELDDFFYNIKETDGIIYDFDGFEIRVNDSIVGKTDKTSLVYITTKVDYRKVFSAVVKSISIKDRQYINIVNTTCNDRVQINKIDIDDIYSLEQYEVKIGSRVNFNVVNNTAILHA